MSINGILNIGRSSLQVNQTALQVTSHNIANVNTPGYTRQRLIVEPTSPFMTGAGAIGTGVRAGDIRRVYDRFLTFQAKSEREGYGRLSAEKDSISQVEDIFNEVSGSGIKERLADFFNSIQDLSNNAGGYTERSQVLAKANTLTYTIRSKASALSTLRTNIDSEIKSKMQDVNTIAAEIADLNGKIAAQESGGSPANDLRDNRDKLMADLSNLIDYNSIEDRFGQVSIFVGKGSLLVEGKGYNALTGVVNGSNLTDITISGGGGSTNITSDISGGELGGLLNVRDGDIADYQNRLNTFASALVNEFNSQHALGFDINGVAGGQFFSTPTVGNEAATISVAITDPNEIAAAGPPPNGPGDNRNALLLTGLQDTGIASLGNTSLDSYYGAIVSDVGIRSQQASRSYEFQNFTKEQLETRIDSISGVSIDEEAANLIKFQRAFEASAKLITTADEIMQTILELKR